MEPHDLYIRVPGHMYGGNLDLFEHRVVIEIRDQVERVAGVRPFYAEGYIT